MNIMMIDIIFEGICIWSILGAFILSIMVNFDLTIFNPVRNYKKWVKLNWFGIFIITLLLNIIFMPYSILYWIYKILFIIFIRR